MGDFRDIRWTEEQSRAIEAEGGELLVSAAAGSGKTAVLTARVIRKITDPLAPCDITRLLVVTFSNEAAREMRQRIEAALDELLRHDRQNRQYARQQVLMADAEISTVHAFCLSLIRDQVHALGLQPDFQVAEPAECELLRAEAVDEAIGDFHENDDGAFAQLCEMVSDARSDQKLAALIGQIDRFVMSCPFPDQWLEEACAQASLPPEKASWYPFAAGYAKQTLDFCNAALETLILCCQGVAALEKAYLPAAVHDKELVKQLVTGLAQGYDAFYLALQNISFPALIPVRGFPDKEELARLRGLRAEVKEALCDLQKLFCTSRKEALADSAALSPLFSLLFEAVRDFERRYAEKKREKNKIDFSDIEQFALRLLVSPARKGYKRTALAREIARRYDEVLVDEYQDTNRAQDLIFQAVSGDGENLFMVGDAKQGIYRFRQASPEIFIEKKERFSAAADTFPAKIVLGRNFRSRYPVTQAVNYIFERVMSRHVGEIDYTDEEKLICGAQYPENGEGALHLMLVESPNAGARLDAEAAAVAREIARMLREKTPVSDQGALRPCQPKDFCILLRSTRNKSMVFFKALEREGIEASADTGEGFFETKEVNLFLSLLQAVNNPLLEVPLCAAMLSPVFAFTPDDLALVRCNAPKLPFYQAVRRSGEEDGPLGEKCALFLKRLSLYRRLAAVLTADRLMTRVLDDTRLLRIVGAMKNGDARRANLLMLVSLAAKYEKSGYRGLDGFLRFLEGVAERTDGSALQLRDAGDPQGFVRILSIHKSKGLEFPFCFLCDCTKRFNKRDLYENLLLHSRFGVAAKVRDTGAMVQYPTVSYQALQIAKEQELSSEEMRILYVALTRPKERLILVAGDKDILKKCEKLRDAALSPPGMLPHYAAAQSSFFGWLMLALLPHPGCAPAALCGQANLQHLSCAGFSICARYIPAQQPRDLAPQPAAVAAPPPDGALVGLLREQLEFVYPYAAATVMPAKLTVTELTHPGPAEDEPPSRPAFIEHEGITAAGRGTALHLFAQHADFAAARAGLEGELDRLVHGRFLTDTQRASLDLAALGAFIRSPLVDEVLASKETYRELRLLFALDADALAASDAPIGEKTVVQGVADLVYRSAQGIVLADYKSDRVPDGDVLIRRYATQLALYRKAVGRLLGEPVARCVIYSFALGRSVEVPRNMLHI